MKSPFSLFLALRYLKPKRTFVSVITLISIVGVMLGITVLLLVISVMTGFEQELRRKVLGFEPHILVSTVDGKVGEWQPLMKTIRETPGVVAAAPYVQGPAIVDYNGMRAARVIRGIDPELEEKVTGMGRFVAFGKGELTGGHALVGLDLARSLHMELGEKVVIYSPRNIGEMLDAIKEAEEDSSKLEGMKKLFLPEELEITGIFETGRYNYDSEFIIVPLHIAQELYGLDDNDELHGIAVRTQDANHASTVRDAILARAPEGTTAQTWEEMNRNFFEAVAMERNVMFFLLMFIIIVAAFGIMNTLITVTMQKTREIGIMKAIGATTWQIVWVFLGQGMIVGFFGNLCGLGLGMLLIRYRNEFKDWLASALNVQVFPADVYQFSRIPAEVVPRDVAVICISAFVVCSLAALFPAYFAARLDPVKALRQDG